MVISWPAGEGQVQVVSTDSTRSRWSRQTNVCRSLRISAPGSRWASHSTWKPLQIPSTGIPYSARVIRSVITGENRAIAPHRR